MTAIKEHSEKSEKVLEGAEDVIVEAGRLAGETE